MMLPSGNDAATVIAEGLGLILYLQKANRFVLKPYFDLESELEAA